MEEKDTKNEAKDIKKPSYDELNNYCNQLFSQNRELYQKLGALVNVYTKLPYLFKVLEQHDFFNPDFVDSMAKEIQSILEIPDTEDNTTENKE